MGLATLLLCVLHGLSAVVLIIISAANWLPIPTITAETAKTPGDGWFGKSYVRDDKYSEWHVWDDPSSDEVKIVYHNKTEWDHKYEKEWTFYTGIKNAYYSQYDWKVHYEEDCKDGGFWAECRKNIIEGLDGKEIKWSAKCRKDPRSQIYLGQIFDVIFSYKSCLVKEGWSKDEDRCPEEEFKELEKRWKSIVGQGLEDKFAKLCPLDDDKVRVCVPSYDFPIGLDAIQSKGYYFVDDPFGGRWELWPGYIEDEVEPSNKDKRQYYYAVDFRGSAFPSEQKGAKVNDKFRIRITWVIFGLFALLLALWDVAMILGLLLGLKFITKLDGRLFRGIIILGFGLVTLGTSADVGIAAGSLGIVVSTAWLVFAFLPLGESSADEEKDGVGSGERDTTPM